MKNQNTQRLQSVLLAAIATIFLLGAFGSAFAQPGSGAKYGSRDVSTCADMKAPAKGAITAELAAQYARCTYEKADRDNIFLLEDLKVQVGGSVPFNPRTYPYMTDINPGAPVYQLRGSYRNYLCAPVSDYMENRGVNCTVFVNTKATGVCYKTTFGDWYCAITGGGGSNDANLTEYKMRPPGFKLDAAPAKDNAAAGRADNQTGGTTKAAADDNKDENGYPKPDFSEMEKFFEIVKWEYDIGDGKFKALVKMTKKTNVCYLALNFYDADGVRLEKNSFPGESCQPELGELTRVYAYLPTEALMKRVTKVVVTRDIH